MKDIPDNSIDMILTDLPYGVTARNKWDQIIPIQKLWQEWQRLTKEKFNIILTSIQPFTSMLVNSNLIDYNHCWIWEKSLATGHLNAHHQPMRIHEDILVFGSNIYNPQNLQVFNKITKRGNNGTNYNISGKENFQEYTNYPKTILKIQNQKNKQHPTQKPVELFEYLIKTYSNEGDLVLDCCAGSGTTAIACINTKRNYICIEKDENYFNIMKERIEMCEK